MASGLPPIRAAAPAEVLAMATARHHVVEASAGTGKTFLIEHRVVDLIVRGGVDIESILVVTFTEKATAELRRRLRAKLESLLGAAEGSEVGSCKSSTAAPGEPAWVIDDGARERLRAALLGFDRAPVFTIHGFCNRMIAQSGFAVGRALRPSQVAGPAAFAGAFAEVVRTELAVEPGLRELLGAWLGAGRSSAELRRHLWSCIERGGELDTSFDPERLGPAVEQARAQVSGAGGELGRLHASTAAAIERRLPPVRAALEAASGAGPAEAQLAALWPAAAEIRWVADKLGGAIAALDAEMVDIHAAVAAAFVPRLRRTLAAHKRAQGQIDFSDMLSQLAESLEGPGGAALVAELRSRFPFALIDEFQDTDELQWAIFRRLYLEAEGGAYLTVVGDPKQAIYGFRGADLRTYLTARRELLQAGAGHTVLETNYRSSPALVAAVSAITAGDFFSGGLDSSAAVRSGRAHQLVDDRGEPAAPVVITVIDADARLAAGDLLERVVERTATEIAALVGDAERPRLQIAEPGASSPRPIRPRDIMVLARTGRECQAMATALRRRGIPSTLIQSQDLFATREAAELADLIRGIANPRSRSARVAALATRFFDLPLVELGRLAEDPDGSEALAQLYRWKALADRFRFESLFGAILADSRLVERELALGRGSRSITNVEHLFEILTSEVVRSRCSLAELGQRLDARITAAVRGPITDPAPLRIEPELEAVNLMTAHAAKGLEAEVVFVIGGYSRMPIGAEKLHVYHDERDRRRLHVGRPPEQLDDRIRAEVRGEDERLMYVAITRAASRLYLFEVPLHVFKVRGSYSPINERLGDRRLGDRPELLRLRLSQLPTAPGGRPALAVVGGSSRDRRDRSDVTEPRPPGDLDHLRAGRAGAPITSYSRMKRSASGDLAHQLGRDQPGASGALGRLRAREAGIFLHWLLERIPFGRVRAASDLEAFARDDEVARLVGAGMRGFDVDASARAEVERLLWNGLTADIAVDGASLGAVIDAEHDAREVEFTFPVTGPGGAPRGYVSGVLDVLFEHRGRLYVLDWKSDALRSFDAESLAAHTAEQYDVQARLYALALARMCGIGAGGDDDDAYQRYGGLVYCYLRAPVCVTERAGLERLLQLESELGAEECWR